MVGRDNTEDYRLGVLAISGSHLSGYFLDILLPFDVDPGDARQIDHGQVWAIVGVNSELDGIVNDISAFACNLVSHLLDNGANVTEVLVHLASGVVLEYTIWLGISFPYLIKGLLLSVWTSLSSRGLLVTTPDPRGRKSRPTMFSKSELFPLDWVPRTAILGKEIYLSSP